MRKDKIQIIILIILLLFIFSVIFSVINIGNSKILSGISINDIDVSKMTKEEATSKIYKLTQEKLKSVLKINYNEVENIDIDLNTLGIRYDINTAINEAYFTGRKGNIFENNYEILKTLINRRNIDINITIDDNQMKKVIEKVSSNLPGKFVDTSYYIEENELIITKGKSGKVLNEQKFTQDVQTILNRLNSEEKTINIETEYKALCDIDVQAIYNKVHKEPKDAYYEKNPFKVYNDTKGVDFDLEYAKKLIKNNPKKTEYKIALKYKKAKVTLKDLNVNIFRDLLGNFSTKYDDRNENRANNLKLAASKIDGVILSPGEEFSYNTIVGKRSISAGYKEAKIYAGGKIIDGLGGGICQLSSTLYNAVVFANLNVTERHNHQFITSYVQPGRDATVAYGSKDLKFVNNRKYPIKIKVKVDSGVAKVQIYGIKEENECNISFDVETVSTTEYETKYEKDESLKEGEEKIKQAGANGVVVKVYKVIKQNGRYIARDFISQDTYKVLNKIVVKND